MRGWCAIYGLLAVAGLLGQNADRPRFAKDGVVLYGSGVRRLMTRGQFVTIYGLNLAPRNWCEEPHAQPNPYPLEVCGVRVLVGGHPAGLMYVGQIGNGVGKVQVNFQVPADAPAEGMVPIVVCVGAVCSDPVEMEFTAKDILLRVQGDAYVRMPVWIEVEVPANVRFSYPFSFCPWDFGGYEFEIRKDDQRIPPASKPECLQDTKGPMSAISLISHISKTSTLPLHLVHQFDSPGTYEIRLTGPLLSPDLNRGVRAGHSDWTQIIVQPYSEEKREIWLRDMRERKNKLVEWKQIVSLLAWPDEKALVTLLRFLPSPPRQKFVRASGNPQYEMSCIAPAALAAFPEELLQKSIPAESLKQLQTPLGWCR